MKADKQSRLTPKLRFPEFAEHSEWELKPLNNLCDRLTKTVGGTKLVPVSISAGKGFVPQAEKFGRDISGSQYSKYIWLRRGEFAYNRGNSKQFPQGCVYQLNEFDEAAASNAFLCFHLHDSYDPTFFLGFFESNGHGRQLRRHITSGARSNGLLNISADTFFGITIPIPPTETEQQKIADCLGSLDDLIAAEGEKLEALRRHKQGLMQQLFPQPGETVPRLRFPEFRGASPWKETPLTEHFADIRNGFVGTATPFYVDKGVPYLQGKNIKKGRIDPSGLVSISEEFHEKQAKSQLKSTDILMVQSGHVGECAVVGANYAGSNCHALIVLSQRYECCSTFFVQYFYSSHGKSQIAEVTTGNTIKHILASDVRSFRVPVPELDERRKVGDFLASFDELIDAKIDAIVALNLWKQGLLQQLFPSPEGNE